MHPRETTARTDAADIVWNAAARYAQGMREALQEADTLMGHDDAFTEWRDKWAHLWPMSQPAGVPDNPPSAASNPDAAP